MTMGLGPHRTSLLERVGKPTGPISLEALIMDREARGQARMIARIRHATKHKAKVKPLAPVEPTIKIKGQDRCWFWVGETILSKELFKGYNYTTTFIRSAGFKLPRLSPKKEKKL